MGLINANKVGKPGIGQESLSGVIKIEYDLTLNPSDFKNLLVTPLPGNFGTSGMGNGVLSLPWGYDGSYHTSSYSVFLFSGFGRYNATNWNTAGPGNFDFNFTCEEYSAAAIEGSHYLINQPLNELVNCEDDLDNLITTTPRLFNHQIYEGVRSYFYFFPDPSTLVTTCKHEGKAICLIKINSLPDFAAGLDWKEWINYSPQGNYDSVKIEVL